jgi:hypothetical protein
VSARSGSGKTVLGLLEPRRAYHLSQSQSDGHLRSAATAWVEPRGDLQLVCSERASVNGAFDGNADSMRFKQGVSYAP